MQSRKMLIVLLLTLLLAGTAAAEELAPLGETISGRKEAGVDDLYLVDGEEGDMLYIAMTSEVFDAYLLLLDEDGNELARDDSSGGDGNPFLTYRLPWSGLFTIVARGYYDDAAGRYTLTIDTFNNSAEALKFGDAVRGDKEGIIPHLYTFEGEEGDVVYVTLETDAFDAYLVLLDEDWNVLDEDDSSGGDGNAYISYMLPWDGTFTVIARGYYNNQVGRYTLNIDSYFNSVQPLEYGAVLEDSKETIIPRLYTFEGEEGDWIYIAMETEAFDAYLVLLDEDWNVLAEDDSSAGSGNAFIGYRLPWDGTFTVIARGYYNNQVGRYNLFFDARSHSAVTLTGGEELEMEKISPIPALYFYEGQAGQTITVTMDSAAFDCYLVLVDEDNNVLVEDDSGGDGSNARLQYTLPADGLYTIIARGYYAAERGIFTLTFDVSG